VYRFIWSISPTVIEQARPRLYGDQPGGDVARAGRGSDLRFALRLLHPVMPFITERLAALSRSPATALSRSQLAKGRITGADRPPSATLECAGAGRGDPRDPRGVWHPTGSGSARRRER